MSRRDELETLLPFYLNGTLEGADLEAVEEWLASDPAAAGALGEAEAEFSGVSAANEAVRPPADALSRFNKMLDAEAGPDAPRRALDAGAAFGSGFMARARRRSPGAPRLLPSRWCWCRPCCSPVGRAAISRSPAPKRAAKHAVRLRHLQAGGDDSRYLRPSSPTTARRSLAGPAAGGVFKIGIRAVTAADYDRIVGLIAAQPFAETVVPGRKPADGG